LGNPILPEFPAASIITLDSLGKNINHPFHFFHKANNINLQTTVFILFLQTYPKINLAIGCWRLANG
jgi:hypothetical protein